jgi:hypothetical protein
MPDLLTAATADGSSARKTRNTPLVKLGLYKYTKTGTGTATLSFIDAWTGTAITTVAIDAGTQAAVVEVPVPSAYFDTLSSVSGTVSISSNLDGDD